MKDPLDIYVDNLREALKQYDFFLRFAILSTVIFFVINIIDPNTHADKVKANLFIASISLSPKNFSLLAMLGQFVFALLAAGSLDAVLRAIRHLQVDQRLLRIINLVGATFFW